MTKKLRPWDNQLLFDTFTTTAQLEAHLENLARQFYMAGHTELPHSMIPSKTLYEIIICYNLMFNMLLDKELIEAGGKKQDKIIH